MGGSAPPDNSAEVARIEAQTAREAREAAAREEAKKQKEFDRRLKGAFGSGLNRARGFFSEQGLDPGLYEGKLLERASDIRGGVPNLDANPSSYFASLGQSLYDELQGSERNRDLRAIDTFAPAGFATDRIADTADDDLINAILGEQRSEADKYLENLFSRGVITAGGKSAAAKNLETQGGTAKARLSDLGRGLLEKGRSGAEKIVNDARTRASNQRLGDTFDPYSINNDVGKFFSDFFSGLGTSLRSVAPTDLFDTSGLPNVAGAAQGAQNTPFNPNALAGIFDDEEDENQNPLGGTSPF